MAFTYTRRTQNTNAFDLNTALSDPKFLELLLKSTGADTKRREKKANFLQRILGPLSGVGSIPDVIYDATKRGKNPLASYGENLVQGFDTLLTGTPHSIKTTSDLLRSNNILQGRDPISKGLNFATSLTGDIALDPVTYVTLGTGGFAKGGAKGAAEAIAKNLGDDVAKGFSKNLLTEALRKEGAKGAAQYLTKLGVADAGPLVNLATKGLKPTRTLSIAGKQIAENVPAVAEGVNAILNPLGASARGVGALGRKFAPGITEGVTDTLNQAFNKRGAAASKGYSGLDEFIQGGAARTRGGITQGQDKAAKLINEVLDNKVSTSEVSNILEGADRKIDFDALTKKWSDGWKAVEGATPHKSNVLSAIEYINNSNQIDPEEALAYLVQAGNKKTIAKTQVMVPLEDMIGRVINKKVSLAPVERQGIIKGVAEDLMGKGTDLYKKGIISNLKAGFVPHDVLGYTEDFLKNEFGDAAARTITLDPAVQKALAKTKGKYIPIEAISEAFRGSSMQGTLSQIGGIEGAVKRLNMERKYPTIAAGKEAGIVYDENLGKAISKYTQKYDAAVEGQRMLQELMNQTDDYGNKILATADDFSGNVVPKNWVKIEGVDELKGYYIPRQAKEVLGNYIDVFTGDRGTQKVLETYDRMLSIWKQSVTGVGPGMIGYNIRNLLGDTSNMLLGGFGVRSGKLSPGAITKSMGLGKDALRFQSAVRKNGWKAAKEKFSQDVIDLYENGIRSGLVGGTQAADEVGKSMSGFEDLLSQGDAGDRAVSAWGKFKKTITDPGMKREEMFRLANLADHYAQTGSWEEAGKLARLSSLDYNNLTSFEKNVMKRVIPFYSFFRQNLELQLHVLNTKPGRMAMQQKTLNNIKKVLEDNGATDEDYALLPDWMKEGMGFIMGKKGRDVNVLTGFGDPTSAINDYIGTTPKETITNILSNTAPPIKMAIEIGTGKNMFTGDNIEDDTNGFRYKDYPDWVKKLIGFDSLERVSKTGEKYTTYTADPMAKYLLENLPIVAPWNTIAKRGIESADDPVKMLNLLSGVRIYEKNLDQLQMTRDREVSDELGKLLTDLGVTSERKGVYLDSNLDVNHPEVVQLLSSMGYNRKVKTQAEKMKASAKAQRKTDQTKQYLSQFY